MGHDACKTYVQYLTILGRGKGVRRDDGKQKAEGGEKMRSGSHKEEKKIRI